jgi:preprotein translocase subunit SecE
MGCERLLMVTKAIQFLSEVRSEVKKVTWPTKKEAMGGTAVVLVVVFIMALFLGLVDLLLSKIIGVIFSA